MDFRSLYTIEHLLSDMRKIVQSPVFERADGVFCAPCCFPYHFLIPLSQALNKPIRMTDRTENTVNMYVYFGQESVRIHPLNYAIFAHPKMVRALNGNLKINSAKVEFLDKPLTR